MARIVLLTAVALVAPLGAPEAAAHALGAECRIYGGRVVLEAYFSDDTPAPNAKVTVRDASGNTVATGVTDQDGRYSFPPPNPGSYTVVVDAGAGHEVKLSLNVPPPSLNSDGNSGATENSNLIAGPGRREFTRIPWEMLLLGLAAIAAIGVGLRVWLRHSGPAPGAPNQV
jgi:hypothetical protein